jgi:hypothetical protein
MTELIGSSTRLRILLTLAGSGIENQVDDVGFVSFIQIVNESYKPLWFRTRPTKGRSGCNQVHYSPF